VDTGAKNVRPQM